MSEKIELATKEEQYTVLQYIQEQFKTFHEEPFHEIDALIFSQMSYFNYDHIVPTLPTGQNLKHWVPIAHLYRAEEFENFVAKTLNSDLNIQLIRSICASPRFRGVGINFFSHKYDKDTEEQFSAVTFSLPTGQSFVAYRGTDFTITGWKEDFNMCFMSPVPSQLSAVDYLEQVASLTSGDMILGGHSKGGNLAVYASTFSEQEIHHRVKGVYNFDGPGFPLDIVEHSAFIHSQEKTLKFVPEGSWVGVMFENIRPPIIVKSYKMGLLQHDPFSWKCDGISFVRSDKFSSTTQKLDKTLNAWIYELDLQQRELLVEAMFTVISALNVENMDEFLALLSTQKETVAQAVKDVDPQTARCIKEMGHRLFQISMENRFGSREDKEDLSLHPILSRILPHHFNIWGDDEK